MAEVLDLGLYGKNGRGLSFEVETPCNNMHTPVRCNVDFEKNSTVVKRFGHFSHNKMDPDSDIAGIGVFLAITIQAWVIFAMMLVKVLGRYPRNKKRRTMHLLKGNSAQMEEPYSRFEDLYYSLLFSITDASLILGFAYIANFLMKGKCTMSTYHYYVSLDSILFVCSTLVASLATLRGRYFRTFAGFLRFIFTLVLFGFIGFFLGYQIHNNATKDFPEWNMGKSSAKGRNDSAILLPVSCFFDPDLIELRNPFAHNGTTPLLTAAQIHLIGAPVKNFSVPEFWIYLFTALAFFVAFFAQICWCCCGRRTGDQKSRRGGCRWYIVLYWFFILGTCFVTNCFCVWHINTSRAWVKGSGWMKDKSEDEWFALSQLLPVMALFYIITAIADMIKFRKCGQR